MRFVAVLCIWLSLSVIGTAFAAESSPASPLVVGETFVLASGTLGETRRINVYLPPGYAERPDARVPVLYMPDGGLAEDFLHIAGLMQVSMSNGTMRSFLLVAIENTQRRRDLTPPTDNAEDKKIAPLVGGSAAFRRFLREELMPEIAKRYRITDERAIVGESLAGLFVIETFLREPELFDHYLAFDPSLWWDDRRLLDDVAPMLRGHAELRKSLWLASSDMRDIADATAIFARALEAEAPKGLRWRYLPMPEEHHWTIYHPAALRAFREEFAPAKE